LDKAFLLLLLPISAFAGAIVTWKPKEIKNSALEEFSGSIQWTEYIVPAPMIISLLGQLAILSNQHADLELTPPQGRNFKHILYPDSFKTTLMQVCDESYYTFQAAHHNMDKLRQQSARVPRLLTDIVELLLTGTDEDINDYLPILLKGVKKVAQQSKELSQQTADKFNQTAILIDEVTLASQSSEGKSKKDLEQAKQDVKKSKVELKFRKQIKEETEEALEKAKQKASDAESEYKEALDNIPSGWEMLGMKLAETAIDLVKTGAKMAMDVKFGTFKTMVKTEVLKKSLQLTDEAFDLNENPSSTATHITQENGMKLLKHASSILHAAIQDFSRGLFEQSLQNKDALTLKCDELLNIKQLERFMDYLEKKISDQIDLDIGITTDLNDVLSNLPSTLVELKRLCPSNSSYDATALSQDIQAVETKLEDAIFTMKVLLRESTLSPPPPTSNTTTQEETPNSEIVSQAMENAQTQVITTKEMVKVRMEEVNKQRELWIKISNQFLKIQEEIMTLDAKIDNLEPIIKLLKKALALLSELSNQWRKMANLFETIDTMVQTWEEGPQKQFIEIVEKRSETVRSREMTDVVKKMMFDYARESAGYAFVINRASNGYFKISSKYLLIPMASLKELMTLDGSDTKMLMEKKSKLKSQTDEAMAHIKTLGVKETDVTKTLLEKRMKDIDQEFYGILSKISPQKKHAIIQDTKEKLNYMNTKVPIVEGQWKNFNKIVDEDFLDNDDFLNDV